MSAVDPSDVLGRLERFGAPAVPPAPFLVADATGDPIRTAAHHRLRADAFVREQGLFAGHDLDEHDADPRTRVLVAIDRAGDVVGGVRLHPVGADGDALGWWRGSRLVCDTGTVAARGQVGAALVRAACARAQGEGALRFDATVQPLHERFFLRLGWQLVRPVTAHGAPHLLMRWPVRRIGELAEATKAPLGDLVGGLVGAGPWRGDDGAPVPGSDLVACTDAITPSMVERDPEWAGWCAMLVTAHDLAAMGAAPIGALDALGAPDAAHAARVVDGMRQGSEVLGLPVLGGHTQLGVPAALSVTGLGRTADPIPAGGGSAGDALSVLADVGGAWRPGYRGRQWDSSTHRTAAELRVMLDAVAVARPRAAKDVSMAGIVGTTGMLAEASGCGATLDVARIPRPDGTVGGDWLTCFPGFAMVCADAPDRPAPPAGAAASARCGVLTDEPGVRLRWPDGEETVALAGGVTGLGRAQETR